MTEQEKLINVDLYGDGSRDSRLRAEYIYCDHADVCSVYKEGKCFRKARPKTLSDTISSLTPTTPTSQKSATVLFSRRPMSESNAARIPGYSVIILGSVAIVSLSLLTS